jgi:hypothetical protein
MCPMTKSTPISPVTAITIFLPICDRQNLPTMFIANA